MDYHLDRAFACLDVVHVWQGGLTLSNTYTFAREAILHYKPRLIYILTGICDLTEIRSWEPRQVALRYESTQGSVFSYMSRVDLVHSQIYSLKESIGGPPMIIFPTLTGMDMAKYSYFPEDLVHPHQNQLNHVVSTINKQIVTQNNSMHISTPFLSSPVHVRCRGRVRNIYSKLSDGCHLTPRLREVWATKLYENSLANLQKYDLYALTNYVVAGLD